jgi:hypothetical protein
MQNIFTHCKTGVEQEQAAKKKKSHAGWARVAFQGKKPVLFIDHQ